MGTMKEEAKKAKAYREEMELLELVEAGHNTTKDVATVLGKTAQTARHKLNRLQEKGYLKVREGKDKKGAGTSWRMASGGRRALSKYRGEPDNSKGESPKEPKMEVGAVPEPVVLSVIEAEDQEISEVKAKLEVLYQKKRERALLEITEGIDEQLAEWAKSHKMVRVVVEVPTLDDDFEVIHCTELQLQF